MSREDVLRDCNDCGAKPGELHQQGCDVERCSLCGHQRISCDCVLEENGIDAFDCEETHPDVYVNGPTEAMYAVFDAEVERLGGRLPWTGVYPGVEACREFGLWCRNEEGGRWHIPCDESHPDASEDLNRLHTVAYWDFKARRWEKNPEPKPTSTAVPAVTLPEVYWPISQHSAPTRVRPIALPVPAAPIPTLLGGTKRGP